MEFVRVKEDCDNLWAVKDPIKEEDELTSLFTKWNDLNYLFDFFIANIDDLKKYFNIKKISSAITDTVDDARELEKLIIECSGEEPLDTVFKPLGSNDDYKYALARGKARNWDNKRHPSWLRIYAIRIERNIYVITGGAIKLTPKMQNRNHTMLELKKLDDCKDFLKKNGVFDTDSFNDLLNE